MKYSEFKAEVEKLGFEVEENPNTVVAFRESDGSIIGKVYKQTTACLNTKWSSFVLLKDNEKNELLDLFARLAKTPLAEREEEKRYYLLFIHPNILGEREPFYLHLHHSESAKDYYEIGTVKAPFGNKLQTIFTESEIEQMDITGFEKVEVTE